MCDTVCVKAQTRAGLTPGDLESLSAALAAGKRATVYLRDPMPSLDLAAGTSARVVSVDGSTVMVSPKGIDDQLPFEADELSRTRMTTPAPESTSRRRTPPTSVTPTRPTADAVRPEPDSRPRTTPPKTSTTPPAEPTRPVETGPRPAAKASRRPKTPTAPVSVTVTAAGESTWTVSVSHGAKKQGRPTEVTADRVARAVRELGDESAIAAVDNVIESARAAAQRRIEELSSELEAARAALAHLDGQTAED
ncbi:DUF6319 family protein [Gordonia terrae]|uniref:DUF6319 family protein n=1 Tax=Gordonia terrae TaxID=2055 RepID=UPI003F6C99A4